ncbi:molybdenum cofactor guanylyltransferase [Haladaptatus litoreus]|uniref:Probable molybdenum cofactor guanylyltransferase n=1 Tax=Haladaptatus litoreus TaxID=553468 RepID=A0A1N6XXN1_9EURY|nr:molybdenum cofactor guanylyltransferase [Haladaptatus litoreus]SIR06969.1 molybdenum cofactor guanylyltransferase [Haladaptatus litoreus]
MPAGVILAGGRSTRFGEQDKAVADLAGVPMLRRVADRIGGVVDELVINCREDQRDAIEEAVCDYPNPTKFAIDSDPDQGPMAGIRTGLAACDDEYAFVVACDMPFVDSELVNYLFERAEGHEAAVPRLGDGWFQTTHAVYEPNPMVEACDTALGEEKRKIVEPLFELDYVVVEEEELQKYGSLESFENVNTKAEFEAAVQRFRP